MFALAASGQILAAEIYRWVDDEGVTHFSDDPPPLPEGQVDVLKVQTEFEQPPPPSPELVALREAMRQRALQREVEQLERAAQRQAKELERLRRETRLREQQPQYPQYLVYPDYFPGNLPPRHHPRPPALPEPDPRDLNPEFSRLQRQHDRLKNPDD